MAIIVSKVKDFAFLVYSKIKGRVDLSSGSTLFMANGTHTDCGIVFRLEIARVGGILD